MDYYGLLFLYYLKGLSGKSVLRLFFNIEAGGTEQLLPENTSIPTTTPILADIQYPDGLRTDQYFTYRETPTTVSNKARIKTIKGNTLVWNQLYQNTNIPTSQTKNGVTLTNNNDGSWTLNGTASENTYFYGLNGDIAPIVGHKYLMKDCVPSGVNRFYCIFNGVGINASQNNIIVTATSSESGGTAFQILSGATVNVTFRPQIFDLTAMGIDSLTVEDFTSLFPLSYYSYNQGSLLSFNGNGIKTVGKNLVNPNGFVQGLIDWQSGNVGANPTWITSPFISVLGATSVTVQGWKDGAEENFMVRFAEYDGSYNVVANTNNINISDVAHYQRKVTLNANTKYIRFSCGFNNRATTPQTFFAVNRVMLEFGGTASDYESYQEDTLSLPITTYFPTGMKRAGNVYDELTESKAITRIGSVDLGTLNWAQHPRDTSVYYTATTGSANIPKQSTNFICEKYETTNAYGVVDRMADKTITSDNDGNNYLYVRDNAFVSNESGFKASLSGVYLYYELATPTETPITTEDANEALSLLMGKSVSSSNAKQMIDIITKGE